MPLPAIRYKREKTHDGFFTIDMSSPQLSFPTPKEVKGMNYKIYCLPLSSGILEGNGSIYKRDLPASQGRRK